MKAIHITVAKPKHYNRLGQIMFQAVRTGPSPYSDKQREAWMPCPRDGAVWNERLRTQHVYIAQYGDKDLIGFMSLKPLENKGYVDFAYILPSARGQGVFRQLFNAIETQAKMLGYSQLSTHASLMAHPAFLAMGFDTTKPETVTFQGAEFDRYEMRKTLT